MTRYATTRESSDNTPLSRLDGLRAAGADVGTAGDADPYSPQTTRLHPRQPA